MLLIPATTCLRQLDILRTESRSPLLPSLIVAIQAPTIEELGLLPVMLTVPYRPPGQESVANIPSSLSSRDLNKITFYKLISYKKLLLEPFHICAGR